MPGYGIAKKKIADRYKLQHDIALAAPASKEAAPKRLSAASAFQKSERPMRDSLLATRRLFHFRPQRLQPGPMPLLIAHIQFLAIGG